MTGCVPSPEPPPREDVVGPETTSRPVVAAAEAGDPGLGRLARRPSEIPPRGWGAVLKRVWKEAISDRASMAAASCAFFALFSLFPAISILISLYGLVSNPVSVERQLEAVRDVLPTAAFDMVAQRVHDLVTTADRTLSWRLVVSALIVLWSAMAGTKALISALNIAYEEPEKRSFLRFNLVALGFTLSGIVGVVIALSAIVGVPAFLRLFWPGPLAAIAVRLLSFLLLLGFVVLGLALLYRYGPSRQRARWHWITPGSALAAILWLLASMLFSFYVSNFASYDAMYGSLGTVIVVLMWFYISAFVVILGAELNGELELQTARDTTTGPERPLGERGAFVADHVAAAE